MMMVHVIKGKCVVCPDSFTVYQIIPEKRWTMDRMDPLAMSDWIFEDHDPLAKNHPGYFKEQGYLAKAFPEIPVTLEDERFTSVLAHRAMIDGGMKKQDRMKKESVDKISAAIILQSYLDKKK